MAGQLADSTGFVDRAQLDEPWDQRMQYELMYIVPSSVMDDDVANVEAAVKAVLEKHGASIKEAKRLGKFRFAYPIKKERHGNYMLVQLEIDPLSVQAMDRELRITPNVLRHLILRADEAAGPYTLVQFAEVNIDAKEDRPRRRREEIEKDHTKVSEEIKSGVAVLEAKDEAKAPVTEKVDALSDAELDKKLAAALEGDAKV